MIQPWRNKRRGTWWFTKPSYPVLTLRYLCLPLDMFFFVGAFFAMTHPRGQCIADRICNTVVIGDHKMRADWGTMSEKVTGERDPMP